jgi:FMN phosphatase YigB (HAD superfamily)
LIGGIDLISVDVGGTLGFAEGPGVATRLIEASPLSADQVRRVMRERLHTKPAITVELIDDICNALCIPPDPAPFTAPPPELILYPWTLPALADLAALAPVVTLSNVTCVDADSDRLAARLMPHVTGHYPSCRTGFAKPDPNAFHAVARQHGARLSQMVHIGDDWVCDVLGAVNAGAHAVWISRGQPVPDETVFMRYGVTVAAGLTTAAWLLTRQQRQQGT